MSFYIKKNLRYWFFLIKYLLFEFLLLTQIYWNRILFIRKETLYKSVKYDNLHSKNTVQRFISNANTGKEYDYIHPWIKGISSDGVTKYDK